MSHSYGNFPIWKSRCPEVFRKKVVLRNFAKFIGKHLRQSIRPKAKSNFVKKETLAQVFSCGFYENF